MTDFVFIFGAIAFVLTVTALASGLVERFPLSFPLIFFGLGSLLETRGFEQLEVAPFSVSRGRGHPDFGLGVDTWVGYRFNHRNRRPAIWAILELRLNLGLHRWGRPGFHRPGGLAGYCP